MLQLKKFIFEFIAIVTLMMMMERYRELQQASILKNTPFIFVATFISKLHKAQLVINRGTRSGQRASLSQLN